MWALALAACVGQGPGYPGIATYDLFPFDCERTWEFISTDTTVPYKLVAISDTPPEPKGDTNVYTLEYAADCFGAGCEYAELEVLRKLQWSSTIGDGVFIHGYAVGEGAIQKFDPPLQLATEYMRKAVDPEAPASGEFAETITGGATWTSVLVDIEACPVKMAVDWNECYKFVLTTDGGDGVPVAGTYWAIAGQGVVAMEIAGDTGQWQLSSQTAEASEDMGECLGEW
jgi:hypothetical protein